LRSRDRGAGDYRRGRSNDTGCSFGGGALLFDLFLELFLEARLVVLKKLAPARAYRVGIGAVALVELFDECGVGAISLRNG
jgi:hypothetical protein